MRIRVWSVFAVVLLLAACSGPKPQAPERTQSGPPDTSSVKINGDASDPVNKLVIQAIADLEEYWGKEMPELYQKDFEPITGGYYAVNPSTDEAPPCASAASDVAGNAFYCSTKDVVAWDAEELLPTLQKKYGDFVIPVVMAHEWGHVPCGRHRRGAGLPELRGHVAHAGRGTAANVARPIQAAREQFAHDEQGPALVE